MSEKLIVFDFDGVLCNSFHDSLFTAIHAYFQLKPENRLPLKSALISQEISKFTEDYPEFCHQFADLMPLSNFARDYYVILNVLESNHFKSIVTQQDFNSYKNNLSTAILDEYDTFFYTFRYDLQQKNPGQWVELLPPFNNIPKTVRALAKQHDLAIATSKDIQSVTILLKKYGIDNYFQSGSILDKDFASSKRDHLKLFHKNRNIAYENMYFIDDKVLHLISTVDLGVNCCLAAWGFNTKREHEIAAANGCRVLQLSELPDLTKTDKLSDRS